MWENVSVRCFSQSVYIVVLVCIHLCPTNIGSQLKTQVGVSARQVGPTRRRYCCRRRRRRHYVQEDCYVEFIRLILRRTVWEKSGMSSTGTLFYVTNHIKTPEISGSQTRTTHNKHGHYAWWTLKSSIVTCVSGGFSVWWLLLYTLTSNVPQKYKSRGLSGQQSYVYCSVI